MTAQEILKQLRDGDITLEAAVAAYNEASENIVVIHKSLIGDDPRSAEIEGETVEDKFAAFDVMQKDLLSLGAMVEKRMGQVQGFAQPRRIEPMPAEAATIRFDSKGAGSPDASLMQPFDEAT